MKTDAGRGKGTRGRGRAKRGRGGASAIPNTSGAGKQGPNSGPFTTTPLPPRNVQPQSNHNEGEEKRLKHSPANGTVPAFVDVKPPVPVPVGLAENGAVRGEQSASPIIVVDDSDVEDDGRPAKKRKVDESIIAVG